MKGRNLVIGMAIGLFMVISSHGGHAGPDKHAGHVAAPSSPAVASPSVRMTPSRQSTGQAVAPSRRPSTPGSSLQPRAAPDGHGLGGSGGGDWFVIAVCAAAISMSAVTVTLTARGNRRAR